MTSRPIIYTLADPELQKLGDQIFAEIFHDLF